MKKMNDDFIRSHHLLLGILHQPKSVGCAILRNFGVTYENAYRIAEEFKKEPKKEEAGKNDSLLSPFAQKAIEMAARTALEYGHPLVDSEHLLYALTRQRDSGAVLILESLMVKTEHIHEYLENLFQQGPSKSSGGGSAVMAPPNSSAIESLLHGLQGIFLGASDEKGGSSFSQSEKRTAPQSKNPKKKKLALDYFCTDLTEQAEDKKLDTIIGRDKEIARAVQILSRKTKNNPILLGDPGVGKTAVVEGLAQKIVSGNVPDCLLDKQVYSLSMSNLVAGTKYRGEFEERIKRIIEEASAKENEVVLFIDELHTIIGAGSAEGSLDAANILKPALSRGTVQVIGATTMDEYKKYIEKDAALSRRFQNIDVPEPTIEESIEILKGVRPHYEKYHAVKITDEATEEAVKLSARYINDRFLPDKAFDVLDEACALKSTASRQNGKAIRDLRTKLSGIVKQKEAAVVSQNYEKANRLHQVEQDLEEKLQAMKLQKVDKKSVKKVNAKDITQIIEQMTDIPVSTLGSSELEQLKSMEPSLNKKIIGQEKAVSEISKAVRKSRVGIQNPNRPLGAFLFLGPTGVGKTELVKQLASEVFHSPEALIKMDMSEFSAGHSASRLVGATAGYVGYEKGGELTDKIRRKPYSVVLFDEIEKAHKDVHNMLLQILEDGELTDGKGRKVSFKNAIIVLTSNVGAERFQQQANVIGFSDTKTDLAEHEHEFEIVSGEVLNDLKKTFSAEFINRLDATVIFKPLNKESIKKILKLQVDELQERLNEKRITLKLGGSSLNYLAKIAYKPEYGAREARRVISDRIEMPLVEELISGNVKENATFNIKCSKNKEVCSFEKV